MHVDRNLLPYVVYTGDPITHALQKISRNRAQVVYCISEHGVLEGVVTDGDFRRWVVSQPEIDLDRPVELVANTSFVSAGITESPAQLVERFSDRIKSVPLVDDRRRLLAIAWPHAHEVSIDGREIGDRAPVFVIAEIGNNHNGDLALAKRLVDAAAQAGADCAKFQMRSMDSLYIDNAAARRQGQDLGDEYTLDLLTRFQLPDEELYEALDYCRSQDVIPLCTPWDIESLHKLEDRGLGAYKIASADLTNHELLGSAAKTGKPLLVSTGMSEEAEIISAIDLLDRLGAPFIPLHCNSTYPAPAKDVRLRYLNRLRELANRPVGYSGHERGIHVAIAAVALGARVVEKHLTLDRSMEGNDHRVSLLPGELGELVFAVREVDQSLGDASERTLTQGERLNREVLGKSVVAAATIDAGTAIEDDMIAIRSPGRGLAPNRREDLVGRIAGRDMVPGDFFFASDVEGPAAAPRNFKFGRPWGIPVRYHDYRELSSATNPDLLEFHLSYRDLDLEPDDAIPGRLPLNLVVHAPELFAGDHLLDLAAADDDYRAQSLRELRRVVDLTLGLREKFASGRPGIILNVGGFSENSPRPPADRARAYERVAEALDAVADPDVDLWPQTMPPFPWHFGGQRFHNLFVDPSETAAFCADSGRRLCLDVSHTALAVHHLGLSLAESLAQLAPHTAHLHLADAHGVDGEGLQVGDGDVDFAVVANSLRSNPGASFIPEVWQGHKNRGEGFWMALDRLERWF